MTARDVIADWIADVACPLGFEHETGKSDFSYADAIVAALDAAGFTVVPKNQTAAFLADNVSDEMLNAFFNEKDRSKNFRDAIAAALRQAAGGEG